MPISLVDRAVASLTVLGPSQIEALPPAERRRLADLCRQVAAIAEPKPQPKAGILSALRGGRQE